MPSEGPAGRGREGGGGARRRRSGRRDFPPPPRTADERKALELLLALAVGAVTALVINWLLL